MLSSPRRPASTNCALLKALPGYWHFIRKIARSYEFMPACRMASVLTFYIRFDKTFKQHKNLKTALIASNYSPECTALAAAAQKNNCKVIYVNHAPVPANSAYVPPVLSDYSVFYGTAMQDIYQRRSRCHSQVVTIGQPVAYLARLDSLPHDYLGFVTDGLACEVSCWHDDLYKELRAFYDNDTWKDKMREYDVSFGVSRAKLIQNLENELSNWIK